MAKRTGPYAAGSTKTRRSKKPKRTQISIRLKDSVIALAKIGAEFHQTGYQIYMQWLLEEALINEAEFYEWECPPDIYTTYKVREKTEPSKPNFRERREVIRLARLANKRVVKAGK